MDHSRFRRCSRCCCCSFMLMILITGLAMNVVESIGINYGQIANNLPSPDEVVSLVKSIGATKVKLYDADPRVLSAFANTGVEFMVGLGNEYLSKIKDPNKAQSWIKSNLQPYLPHTNITSIFVGNEILTFNDTSLTANLLPAMQSVHTALVNLNLDRQITVTTTHSLAVLQTSYPPSSGSFRPDLAPCLAPILSFQAKTGSPFLINAYPYFAYKSNPKQISLDYALFQPNQGMVDPATNLHYDNMLFAQIDAVYSALASMGYSKLPVHISETGWPSKGDQDETGASLENAKKYNGNLIKMMSSTATTTTTTTTTGKEEKGTPMRPNNDLNIYVFALFNENMKPGPTSERNYGLFKPDCTPAYPLSLSSSSSSSPPSGDAVNNNNNTNSGTPSLTPASSSGYLSISSATSLERYRLLGGASLSFLLPLLMELMTMKF
ncbi:glucan endo-1,3-beta-glucosidase 11 [Gastrolobium bilobum]|uniref:glucan endo-1,3-beta-glucosidase 11 n=1 Tax=Gastrolobium bilobum TaxID=150636 RepID=UPI002AAF3BC8|nr:glucan endo-1,3-beta-glucosidase 11 [Gastrolobium bilobum]